MTDQEKLQRVLPTLKEFVKDVNLIGVRTVVGAPEDIDGGCEWGDLVSTYHNACEALRAIGVPDDEIKEQWEFEGDEEVPCHPLI